MSGPDDLVIEGLAGENAELRERAALANSYRELACVAINRVAEQNAEIEGQRRQIAALRAEVRRGRARAAA